MSNGSVVAIYISPIAGEKMQKIMQAEALAGQGLKGDRYAVGEGSFNQKSGIGNRQLTLMNSLFFRRSSFSYEESRRNIFTEDVELMWLIGREFKVGEATVRGIKYCDPCMRPSKLNRRAASFAEEFEDCGGLVAEILTGGLVRVGDLVIPPPKGY